MAVAQVTAVAAALMQLSSYVQRRLNVRIYIEVVVAIVGLLSTFIALTHLVA
jgi:hypothetical protein